MKLRFLTRNSDAIEALAHHAYNCCSCVVCVLVVSVFSREFSWNLKYDMLYIDSPVSVFSV